MSASLDLADYYARRAPEYERIYQLPERQPELGRLKKLVRTALAGRNVLEVACGTGYWTAEAARVANSIAAFDINESVLQIARQKSVDPRKATFAVGDAYAPPVPPQQFNAGLAAFWWSHVPHERLDGFLKRFHQALLPGARVVFMDNTFVPGESTAIQRHEAGNTYQLRRLESGGTFEVLKNYPTEQELRDTIRATLRAASEVRPSSAAEVCARLKAMEDFNALASTTVPAPEDGRTPPTRLAAADPVELEIKWFKYYWWLSYRLGTPPESSYA